MPETGEVNRVSRNAYFHERQFLRDIDSLDPSSCVQQPTPDSLGDPFPEEQCLTSDPLRAREYLELPLWARGTDTPVALTEVAAPRPRRVHWWDETPPSGGGPLPLVDDSDDEEPTSPSPTGPPGGAAGEGECVPPAPSPALPSQQGQEAAGDLGSVHPQPSPPMGQMVEDPEPSPELPEAQGDPPELSSSVSPEVSSSADAGGQSSHQPTRHTESLERSSSEGERHTPTSSSETSGSSDAQPEVITLRDIREPERRVYPSRERHAPLHFSPQLGGKRHHIYRRAGMAAVFLTSAPPQRWKVPKSIAEANRSDEAER